MLSAIYHSPNKLRGGSEVNVSLPALLANMIKHEPALKLFAAFGSYSPGNQELLAVILEFGVAPVFPITCQGEHCIFTVLS